MGLAYVRCMHGQGSACCPIRLHSYSTPCAITYILHKDAATGRIDTQTQKRRYSYKNTHIHTQCQIQSLPRGLVMG
jgi:hypothetical protein